MGEHIASAETVHPSSIDETAPESDVTSFVILDPVVSGSDGMLTEREAPVTAEFEAAEECYEAPLSVSTDENLDLNEVSSADQQGPDDRATSMDHAQVLISQSLAFFRSRASRVVR